jgi:hypothetical protein
MEPRGFVAIAFGTKPNREGTPVDFDRVYAELIKPALEDAGCAVFRTDVPVEEPVLSNSRSCRHA